MNENVKKTFGAVLALIGAWALSNWLWDKFSSTTIDNSGDTTGDTTGDTINNNGGTGTDTQSIISAINQLTSIVAQQAAGVNTPPIRNYFNTLAGSAWSIPVSSSAKRICVAGYCLTGAQDVDVVFWSGNKKVIWRLRLNAVAGNTGANMVCDYPMYIFATDPGDALYIAWTGTDPSQYSLGLSLWEE